MWDMFFSTAQVLMISGAAFLGGLTLGYLLRVGGRKPAVPTQAKEESHPAPGMCVHCGNHVTCEQWVPYHAAGSGMFWLCPYCGLAKEK